MEIQDKISSFLKGASKLTVIGIGSELRGDDAAGIYIANKLLKSKLPNNIHIFNGGTTPENLTGLLRKDPPTHIIMVDAAKSGNPVGTVSIIEPEKIESMNFSTHTFSLNVLIKFIEDDIGSKVMVIGIEPKDISMGQNMSDVMVRSADKFVEMMANVRLIK